MSTHFWSSPAATWRLARFAVIAVAAVFAVWGFSGPSVAIVVGVVAASLLLIDEVLSRRALSRRTGVTGRGSAASV